MLKWTPPAFWASTPHEFFDAIEGARLASGGKPSDDEPTDWQRWHDREFGPKPKAAY